MKNLDNLKGISINTDRADYLQENRLVISDDLNENSREKEMEVNPYIRRYFYSHCLVNDIDDVSANGYNKLLVSTGISDTNNPSDNQTSADIKISLCSEHPIFKEDTFGTAYLIEVNNNMISITLEKEFFAKVAIFNISSTMVVEDTSDAEHQLLTVRFNVNSLTSILRHLGHSTMGEYSGVFELEFVRALVLVTARYHYDNETLEYYRVLADSKDLVKAAIKSINIDKDALQKPSGHLTQMILNDLL